MFSYFSSFPVNFLKEGQGAKEGKVLDCTHTLLLRKLLTTVAANSSQMSLP